MEDLPGVALETYRELRAGRRVVVVVSALFGETDRLDRSARSVVSNPDELSLTRLLATGEAASAALVALQLNTCGIPAVVLDPHEIKLYTTGPRLNSDPVSVDRTAIDRAFCRAQVIVVSGFVGCFEDNSPALLGRGGSDATALFLASALDATECRLVKDVDGLYPEDPALAGDLRPFVEARWDTALACCGPLIQEKAIRYAQSRNRPFRVCTVASRSGTWIGTTRDRFDRSENHGRKLGVGLTGLDEIGLVLCRWLSRNSSQVEIKFVTPAREDQSWPNDIDLALLTRDPRQLDSPGVDTVLDTARGWQGILELLCQALEGGGCTRRAKEVTR